MDLFNRSELRRLAESEGDVSISLYMPTYRNESDWSQNTTRLKNLLREARNQLREQDYREDAIDDLLADARQLLDRPSFWRENIGDGLALFIAEDTTEAYRLPLTFDEVSVVENRFHLKPLFPLIAANNRFYVLALSQNDVRLYQGTHQTISEIETADIPSSIVEAMQTDDAQPQVQSHVQNRETGTDGDRMDAAFHGQGEKDDLSGEPHEELKQFFREVDDSVDQRVVGVGDGVRVRPDLTGQRLDLVGHRRIEEIDDAVDPLFQRSVVLASRCHVTGFSIAIAPVEPDPTRLDDGDRVRFEPRQWGRDVRVRFDDGSVRRADRL